MALQEIGLTSSEMAVPRYTLRSSAWARRRQRVVIGGLILCTSVTLLTTIGTIAVLAYESSGFFFNNEIELKAFFTGTTWTIGKTQGPVDYGILPLLLGTFRVAAIALAFAIPIGLLCAIYLSEYAPTRVRAVLKPILEILAGIPTVVLGFFAVSFLNPHILNQLADFRPFNAMSAGLAVGILCLPLVTSLIEDALHAVPQNLRDAASGLGATRFEMIYRAIIPSAASGIIAAILLSLARATGETMIVAVAAGSIPTMTLDPREPSQTMTGFIVETINSETIGPGSLGYDSIYAIAAILFLVTLGLSLLGQLVHRRYREVAR
ncbi:MAG TPA: phosphate ABC transporter permease subunit PstC [Pirellulaceae bacterium]|nr:phosphate ABC transporter permease subunit PstC [Pirellulaceae bacterium]HMO92032.1 phosphate ABC transporter permease subunit PstC [Pirellulaceae bacterium]HMP68831.1 phosphate ABC transporter permease subunit PstC [Pirellulaceae bacterium]